MERGLYQLAGVETGDVWRTVRISERVLQSADTVSLTLFSLDGSALPTFAPGQYLSVGIRCSDSHRDLVRCQDVSGSPDLRDAFTEHPTFRR